MNQVRRTAYRERNGVSLSELFLKFGGVDKKSQDGDSIDISKLLESEIPRTKTDAERLRLNKNRIGEDRQSKRIAVQESFLQQQKSSKLNLSTQEWEPNATPSSQTIQGSMLGKKKRKRNRVQDEELNRTAYKLYTLQLFSRMIVSEQESIRFLNHFGCNQCIRERACLAKECNPLWGRAGNNRTEYHHFIFAWLHGPL